MNGSGKAGRRSWTLVRILLGAGLAATLVLAGCAPAERVVDFTASAEGGLAPLPVVFTAAADADAQSYAWDFGDGSTASEAAVLHVYRGGGIYTVTLTVMFAGGETASVTKTDLIEVAQADARPGSLYWIDAGGVIWRGARDGSSKDVVVTSAAGAHTLEIESGTMYWTVDAPNGQIMSANLDGTGRRALVTGIYRPRGLAIDRRHSKIYWTTFPSILGTPGEAQAARAMRANLDGTSVEAIYDFWLLSPEETQCADVLVADSMVNRLVWAFQSNGVNIPDSSLEQRDSRLQAVNMDGKSLRTLRSGFYHMWDLVLDLLPGAPALHMYWIYWGGTSTPPELTDTIVRANPNAEIEAVLVRGIEGGTSLDIDVAEDALYWSDAEGIHRAGLDGTNPVLIFPEADAQSIALDS